MPEKILVAEDDDAINEVVCEYLIDAGFEPVSVMNGREALEVISGSQDIGLFILDIMLPDVSGLELLRTIRESETYGEAPVMMLTALTDERTQLSSFNGQTDDYVTKPFSPKILIKRVEALLKRCKGSSPEKGQTLEIGQVQVDVDGYGAYENGLRLELTLKELELLKVLMINAQKVLSRQQLLDLVWGYDYFGDERIVDVHIKNLRKKIKSNLIHTVKGVGYKADAT